MMGFKRLFNDIHNGLKRNIYSRKNNQPTSKKNKKKQTNQPVIEIYDDGSVVKKVIIE